MIEIELPFPPRELSPNARVHWRVKAEAVSEYRMTAGWLAKEAMHGKSGFPLATPVQARATFFVARRQHDKDNLAAMLKAAWDGFADAGLLAGDRADQLTVLPPDVYLRERSKERSVTIVLRGAR